MLKSKNWRKQIRFRIQFPMEIQVCKSQFWNLGLWGQSHRALLIMTRFENDYNPHIIYDASCLAKEYGYNHELRRFMKLTITTDRFHQCNHSTCSNSFKSSEYSALNNVNSEACEQVNALLRKISSSTTYMSPKMYIKAITLFLADQNFNSKRRK